MKCRSCRGPAVIEIRRHHAAFCADHFLAMFRNQVERAITRFRMIEPGDRVLLAVSGGKDSLALWDVLLELGHDVTGLYLGLGSTYSDRSLAAVETFARARGADLIGGSRARTRVRRADRRPSWQPLHVRGLRPVQAVRVQSRRTRRRVRRGRHGPQPRRRGRDPARQHAPLAGRGDRPAVPDASGPRRHGEEGEAAPPAVGAGDRGLRLPAWIDYVVEECPLVAGNTQLRYKGVFDTIERTSPGTKAQFFLGYLDRGMPLFAAEESGRAPGRERCGQPTTGRFCAFCRARAQVLGERLDARDDPAAGRGRARRRGAPRRDLRGRRDVSAPLEAGEKVLLDRPAERTYLFALEAGATYHTHAGTLRTTRRSGSRRAPGRDRPRHGPRGVPPALRRLRPEDAAGRAGRVPEGPRADRRTRTWGRARACSRPAPAPAPHDRALPGGGGAGARGLLRVLRPEHLERAGANVEAFFGKVPDQLELVAGDVAEAGARDDRFDRAVLDLPEPWGSLERSAPSWSRAPSCARTCRPRPRSSARPSRTPFLHLETLEVLHRAWHVTRRSVRPEHRMVGHTGFLTLARVAAAD